MHLAASSIQSPLGDPIYGSAALSFPYHLQTHGDKPGLIASSATIFHSTQTGRILGWSDLLLAFRTFNVSRHLPVPFGMKEVFKFVLTQEKEKKFNIGALLLILNLLFIQSFMSLMYHFSR